MNYILYIQWPTQLCYTVMPQFSEEITKLQGNSILKTTEMGLSGVA